MKDLTTVGSCHFYLLHLQHNMPPSPTPAAASEPQRWNTSLVALVGVVCALFLLLCCYKALQRDWCAFNGLTFLRSRVQSRRLNEENQDDPSLQFQSRGLDYLVMHSLPITQFEKKKEESDQLGQSNTECAVCLGEFEEGEWLKHLPNCSHAFHVSCIDTWFQTHSSCPLCRSFVNDLAMDHECTISMDTLRETLQREDFLQDRSSHYQVFRSHILQNSPLTMDP